MTLTPAYGKDYKSRVELQKAIDNNEDFILNDFSSPWNGKPCSPSDFKGKTVGFRYKKLTAVAVIEL